MKKTFYIIFIFLLPNLLFAEGAIGIGNMGFDTGEDISVDANGNVYVTGDFQGTVDFDASKFSSGLYFYKIEAGDPSAGSGHGFVQIRKMMLLK